MEFLPFHSIKFKRRFDKIYFFFFEEAKRIIIIIVSMVVDFVDFVRKKKRLLVGIEFSSD